MNTSFRVLWVYQTTQHGAMKKYEAGQKPSLCFKGRKHMLCVAAGHPVRVLVREAKDFDRLRVVMRDKAPYAPLDAAKKFDEIGRRCGITVAARKILDRVKHDLSGTDDLDEDQFTNEEDTAMVTDDEAKTDGQGAEDKQTKETKVSKTKKAKKPVAKKPVAKKPAKTGATKKATTPKNPMGKEGSIALFINQLLVEGKDNETVSKAATKKFPDAKAVDAKTVAWYRWSATKKGLLKKKA
jgi:hypothetical protein